MQRSCTYLCPLFPGQVFEYILLLRWSVLKLVIFTFPLESHSIGGSFILGKVCTYCDIKICCFMDITSGDFLFSFKELIIDHFIFWSFSFALLPLPLVVGKGQSEEETVRLLNPVQGIICVKSGLWIEK